jgi:8-oxo-dGTP diphosphatase
MTDGERTRVQAIVVDEGRVLMVQHWSPHRADLFWCFPGGGLEPGETAEAGVRREVLEETGITLRNVRLVLDGDDIAPAPYRHLTFVAEVDGGTVRLGRDPEQRPEMPVTLRGVAWRPLRDEGAFTDVDRAYFRAVGSRLGRPLA